MAVPFHPRTAPYGESIVPASKRSAGMAKCSIPAPEGPGKPALLKTYINTSVFADKLGLLGQVALQQSLLPLG